MRPLVENSKVDWHELGESPGAYCKDLVTAAHWTAMSVHQIRVQPGRQIAVHVHGREAETHFVISGQGVGRAQNEEYLVRAGDAFLVEPGVEHGLANSGQEDLVLLCVFSPPLV